MRKIIPVIFVLVLALAAISPARAAASLSVTNNDAPGISMYRSSFDQLVMDLTLKRSDSLADTLKALTIQNTGSAGPTAITKVVVWSDAGPVGFQGMGVDKELGTAVWNEVYNYWYIKDLTQSVPAAGVRIFASVETATSTSINYTVQMQVPALVDGGTIGSFDIGDMGVYFEGVTGPSAAMTNTSVQTIVSYYTDVAAPKTVITDPASGATITTGTYKIIGQARDNGGSTPSTVKISFNNGAWQEATAVGSSYLTWEYDWVIPADGTYVIKTQGEDWVYNKEIVGTGITVTVDTGSANAISAVNSSLISPDSSLAANGIAKATITATIKSAANAPMAGKIVSLVSDRGAKDTIKTISATTDANGRATFEVSSTTAGQATFSPSVDGGTLSTHLSLTFTQVSFSSGDLVKASQATVYYYGSDGKRYVFPNEKTYMTWYSDFSGVKTISDSELASISLIGNVTYKPGVKMVKITTDPKVYAVSAGGTLRWVKTEAIASALYGANWSAMVEDVPDSFFVNYIVGTAIESAAAFNVAEVTAAAKDINTDKESLARPTL